MTHNGQMTQDDQMPYDNASAMDPHRAHEGSVTAGQGLMPSRLS